MFQSSQTHYSAATHCKQHHLIPQGKRLHNIFERSLCVYACSRIQYFKSTTILLFSFVIRHTCMKNWKCCRGQSALFICSNSKRKTEKNTYVNKECTCSHIAHVIRLAAGEWIHHLKRQLKDIRVHQQMWYTNRYWKHKKQAIPLRPSVLCTQYIYKKGQFHSLNDCCCVLFMLWQLWPT